MYTLEYDCKRYTERSFHMSLGMDLYIYYWYTLCLLNSLCSKYILDGILSTDRLDTDLYKCKRHRDITRSGRMAMGYMDLYVVAEEELKSV